MSGHSSNEYETPIFYVYALMIRMYPIISLYSKSRNAIRITGLRSSVYATQSTTGVSPTNNSFIIIDNCGPLSQHSRSLTTSSNCFSTKEVALPKNCFLVATLTEFEQYTRLAFIESSKTTKIPKTFAGVTSSKVFSMHQTIIDRPTNPEADHFKFYLKRTLRRRK